MPANPGVAGRPGSIPQRGMSTLIPSPPFRTEASTAMGIGKAMAGRHKRLHAPQQNDFAVGGLTFRSSGITT